jgi:hypothetical protein
MVLVWAPSPRDAACDQLQGVMLDGCEGSPSRIEGLGAGHQRVCARTHAMYQHRQVAFARLAASAICDAILSLPAGTLLALIGVAALNVASE